MDPLDPSPLAQAVILIAFAFAAAFAAILFGYCH